MGDARIDARQRARSAAMNVPNVNGDRAMACANAASDVWEPLLRGVLDYTASGGWTRGRPDGHAPVERIDLDTLEPRPECRCGHVLPCPMVEAWAALGG